MDADFWLEKWQSNVIGFHLPAPNPLLIDHLDLLAMPSDGRIFVPLCGKTHDIGWLLGRGYHVLGCELSELAVKALFDELKLDPVIHQVDNGLHYSVPDIDIFVMDVFELSSAMLGKIDAVYDRAALIALPAPTRSHYATHLMSLTHCAPQLLITLLYDQSELAGPPFSVSDGAVQDYYAANYELELLSSLEVPGGIKGQCAGLENVWLLSVRNQS